MVSAVYLHDGENKITVTFRTEEDRERFKAHYRTLDVLGMRFRDERDDALGRLAVREATIQTILDLSCNELLTHEQACKEIERHAAAAFGPMAATDVANARGAMQVLGERIIAQEKQIRDYEDALRTIHRGVDHPMGRCAATAGFYEAQPYFTGIAERALDAYGLIDYSGESEDEA
jgi:hypothetical protein